MIKILIILITLCTAGFLFPNILMKPYLQAVSTNSIYVLVECNTPDTVTINYGITVAFGLTAKTESIELTNNSTATYLHNVKLTSLQPNTLYYYNAVQGITTSQTSSFRSAALPGTNFRITWLADLQTTNIHDQLVILVDSAHSVFSLYGGDICNDSTYASFKTEFFRTNQLNVITKIPFFNSPGNHEGWTQNTRTFTQSPLSSSGTQNYYSFDYGDIHVLVLNNSLAYTSGSPQYIFAQNDLASTAKTWKIVISHYPAYCSGGTGETPAMVALAQNVFVPNHVDVVISGHAHFYQHNLVSGIHYFILGGGGASLSDPLPSGYTIKSVKDYHFGIIDITPSSFFLKVVNNLNVLLDTVRLNKIPININSGQSNNPAKFMLYQNYPNPFNPITKIKFSIPPYEGGKGDVSLIVYDVLGREVATLVNELLKPGTYEVEWPAPSGNGSNFASGVYYYKLIAGNYSETKRMVLIK
jgi:hypothetical protein